MILISTHVFLSLTEHNNEDNFMTYKICTLHVYSSNDTDKTNDAMQIHKQLYHLLIGPANLSLIRVEKSHLPRKPKSLVNIFIIQ